MPPPPEDCDRLETPPDGLGAPVVRDAGGAITDIYATPRGDDRYVEGDGRCGEGLTRATLPLAEALALAPAGATVHLLPGMYYRAVALYRRRGREHAPIRIRGSRAPDGTLLSVLCGTNAAGSIYPKLPDGDDYAFFNLVRCEHIEISDVAVQDCWPCFVYAEDCSGITLSRIDVRAGTYVLFARGRGSAGFTVRDSRWVQDPTGALWSEIPWDESHHGRYAYYNGALFGSVDIAGDIRIEGNRVANAFNGVRMTADPRAGPPPVRAVNVNVVICGNTFENIRDNAVEPEATALNWHVFHNRIRNCHAVFSLQGVRGGFWYLYGNVLWFDDRPGRPFQGHRGGQVYKLDHREPFPDRPVFVFNNSLYLRTFLIKNARAERLIHKNNAVQFCRPEDYPEPCLCRDDRDFFRGFPYRGGPWPASVAFDYDLSSKSFEALRREHGQELHGLGGTDAGFRDPAGGDLRLRDDSPARGAGTPIRLRAGHDWAGSEDWSSWPRDGRPNIGAWQDAGLTVGPPVVRIAPTG